MFFLARCHLTKLTSSTPTRPSGQTNEQWLSRRRSISLASCGPSRLCVFAGDETRLYLESDFLHERQKQRFVTPYSKKPLQSSAHCHHGNPIMLREGPVSWLQIWLLHNSVSLWHGASFRARHRQLPPVGEFLPKPPVLLLVALPPPS